MVQKISIIEEKIKNDNNELSDNYLVFMNEVFPKIESTYDKIKYSKSSNLKFFLISSFNDSYLNEILGIYNHLVQYLNRENLSSKIPLSHIRKKYIMLSEDFYNLTGFPIKSFIEFKNNWQLVENEQLYKAIISDDLDDSDYQKGEKTLIIMNRRQKIGVETPRKRRKYSLSKKNNKNINKDNNNISTSNDKKNEKNKRLDSIEVREEKSNEKTKIKTKNKIPKFIPKSKINNSNNNLLNKFERFDGIIKTIIFNRIRYSDKSEIKSNKSEEQKREYKIYNIKRKNFNEEEDSNSDSNDKKNDIEVILLKEKFVFYYLIFQDKELEESQNEKVKQNIFGTIKPFEIVNITKTKINKIEKKNIFGQNMRFNNNFYPQKTTSITNKLDELSEKLSKYENMVQNLGKEFINNSNVTKK